MLNILISDTSVGRYHQSLGDQVRRILPPSCSLKRCGLDVLSQLESRVFDLAFIDCGVLPCEPQTLFAFLHGQKIKTKIVLLEESPTVERAVRALKAGAADYLSYPVDDGRLLDILQASLGRREICVHILAYRLDLYIRQNCQRPLCLADVGEALCISPSYASRLLRRHLGDTFRQRLRFYRVQRAKKMLRETGHSMGAIAAQCGFRNISRLSEAFSRQQGLSPRQFRLYGGRGRASA